MAYINAMEMAIDSKGYRYIDFTDLLDEMNIKFDTDFADETHLNHFGAEKLTDYLCEYILDNFSIKTDRKLKDWDQCVEHANKYYELVKEGTLKGNKKEYFELDLAEEYQIYGVKDKENNGKNKE